MVVLVDLGVGVLILAVAGLVLGVALKLIKENSNSSEKK